MNNLVLVHGFLGSSLNWGPVLTKLRAAPELLGRWNFHTVDLLGHAYRPLAPGVSDLDLADVAEDLLKQLPFAEPFVALGHSFGLRPLLWIAKNKPGRMKALIAEDSGPTIRPSSVDFLMGVLKDTPVPFPSREAARDYFDAQFGKASALSRFLFSNIREDSGGGQAWRFAAEALKNLLADVAAKDQWSEWTNYPNPIILIRGENSEFQSAEMARESLAKRDFKDDQFIQIPQAGHWVHSENLSVFSNELIQALQKFA